MAELSKVVLFLSCMVVFMILAASCGGDRWYETPMQRFGLWNTCNTILDKCDSYNSVTSELGATRAFVILSVLTSVIGIVLSGIIAFTEKDIAGRVAGVAMIVCGVFGVIGMSVYTEHVREVVEDISGVSWGWAFALGWLGTVGAFLAAIIAFITK